MADRIIQRNDTAARWAEVNPILAMGELGIETDGSKGLKVGDGVTPWNDLPYSFKTVKVVQELGESEEDVISQKIVTQLINNMKPKSGEFDNKPDSPVVGTAYFCTDRQTAEGATDGIIIYHKGENVWVDALGRVVE